MTTPKCAQSAAKWSNVPGIFAILAEAREGLLKPGDDLLFLVVAGDIRENVKSVFAELLDRIKSEAVLKQEYHEV